jgi:hypothetical protein
VNPCYTSDIPVVEHQRPAQWGGVAKEWGAVVAVRVLAGVTEVATEPVTEDFNFVDLVWHECEFRDGSSFTYAVYDKRDRYLGCCYLYPMGTRTPLREELLAYDVDVSWWVTPHAYEHGYYTMLYAALQHWIKTAFPFTSAYYSNTEIPANPGP